MEEGGRVSSKIPHRDLYVSIQTDTRRPTQLSIRGDAIHGDPDQAGYFESNDGFRNAKKLQGRLKEVAGIGI